MRFLGITRREVLMMPLEEMVELYWFMYIDLNEANTGGPGFFELFDAIGELR